MPKGGRARGRKQTVTHTQALNTEQRSKLEPKQPYRRPAKAQTKVQTEGEKHVEKDVVAPRTNQPHRPRTRAWAKQQLADQPRRPGTRAWTKQYGRGKEEQLQSVQIFRTPTNPIASTRDTFTDKTRPNTKQPKPLAKQAVKQAVHQVLRGLNTGKNARHKSNSRKAVTQAEQRLRTHSKSRSAIVEDFGVQRRGPGGSKSPRLAGWLNRVESISPEGTARARALYTAPVPGILPEEDAMMQESSSSANTGENSGENVSTAREKGSRTTRLSAIKLRYRRIHKSASTDGKLEHLASIIKVDLPPLSMKETRNLQSTMQDFFDIARDNPNANCYEFIDDFSFNFDKAKSEISYPVINGNYFNSDLTRCLTGNEAVLQRTVMIHIINQYWLGKMFDWNSEGQWSLTGDTRLPSSQADTISSPKPDLAMFFVLDSFTGKAIDDPVPPELEKSISPDGGDRCFPFLFMELKKAGADLQDAYMANLHSASQALYNIYGWMVRVEREDEFFRDVRVFSLVFNAQDLSFRVHRAEKHEGAIFFHFVDLLPLQRYTKDQACLLVRTTVTEYAEKQLHPILKATFKEVVAQEKEQIAAKRKASSQGLSSEKRTKRGNSLLQTSQTFAMSGLSTT